MKSQSIESLNSTIPQLTRNIKDEIEGEINFLQKQYKVNAKQALYIVTRALQSAVIKEELIGQYEYYIENNMF